MPDTAPRNTSPGAAPSALLRDLVLVAAEAGALIMRHYRDGTEHRAKADNSPVTAADEEAERLILARLAALAPGVPVVAEEEAAAGRIPAIGDHFFLVDPLDGTREFIGRSGEFTVNIGEIRHGAPVRGVVYAPALGRMFAGEAPGPAHEGAAYEIPVHDGAPDWRAARVIHARVPGLDGLVVTGSRSHANPATAEYLKDLPVREFLRAGSSLKFCLIAAGEADLYPRTGPTSEWDTAAGHALLLAAGGSVTRLDGAPLVYGANRHSFLNPEFVAKGRNA